jgi:hypothetical protein
MKGLGGKARHEARPGRGSLADPIEAGVTGEPLTHKRSRELRNSAFFYGLTTPAFYKCPHSMPLGIGGEPVRK